MGKIKIEDNITTKRIEMMINSNGKVIPQHNFVCPKCKGQLRLGRLEYKHDVHPEQCRHDAKGQGEHMIVFKKEGKKSVKVFFVCAQGHETVCMFNDMGGVKSIEYPVGKTADLPAVDEFGKRIHVVIRCVGQADVKKLRMCMDYVEQQVNPVAYKKTVMFINCREPKWFGEYPSWNYTFRDVLDSAENEHIQFIRPRKFNG